VSRLRYLNGIDWVITGLDHSLRQTAGLGNWSQLVFELDGEPDFDRFNQTVQRYTSSFPVLQGRTVRGWQLAPAWKTPRRIKPVTVPVKKYQLPDDASFETITKRLGKCVTTRPGTPGRYIGFNLLYAGEKTFLAFRFDHRLFDARGAELFLQGLIQYSNAGDIAPPPLVDVCAQKPSLSPWIRKFKSGQQVVRMLLRHQEEAAPFNLTPRMDETPSFRFSVISLNQAESDCLLDRAYEEAGYLMLTPWLADRMSAALEHLKSAVGKGLKGCLIPCSVDLRSDAEPQLFFNHAAFVYLHGSKKNDGKEKRAQSFSRQFVGQIKADMPRHFENAWKLARILPAPLYGRLLRKELSRLGGTFSIASVGNGLSGIEPLGDSTVQNVFHMPMVPPTPGLGFFANTFGSQMNFCLTSSSGVLSEEEHAQLVGVLRRELFNQA